MTDEKTDWEAFLELSEFVEECDFDLFGERAMPLRDVPEFDIEDWTRDD